MSTPSSPFEPTINQPTDSSQRGRTRSPEPGGALDQFRSSFYGPPVGQTLLAAVVRRDGGATPQPGDNANAPAPPADNPRPPAAQAGDPQAGNRPAENLRAGQGEGKIRVNDWAREELNRVPQPLRDNVTNWVRQVGSQNPQERAAALAGLRENPREASLAFRAALGQADHPIHRLFGQLTSTDANVQRQAFEALQPFGDGAMHHIQDLIKNQPNSEFVQGLNRLVDGLASANPQNAEGMRAHNDANRALERLRLMAPAVVDNAIKTQLENPNSAMSRTVDNLIRSLGSPQWREREGATQALSHVGPAVLPKLEQHRQSPDLEVRNRINQLMDRIPDQHMRRVVDSLVAAGSEHLPRTGNAEQDRAVQERFRNLVEGALRGNPEQVVRALGDYQDFINQWGKRQTSFQANSPQEWQAMARAMQRALDSNPRTQGLIARVTPQGNFMLGTDQNEGAPGSSLITVHRDGNGLMWGGLPLSFRTVQAGGNMEMRRVTAPPPSTASEALRDTFMDRFGDGLVQRHQTQVQLPGIPPGFGGLMIPPTVQIPHWGPYISRQQQFYEQLYSRNGKKNN